MHSIDTLSVAGRNAEVYNRSSGLSVRTLPSLGRRFISRTEKPDNPNTKDEPCVSPVSFRRHRLCSWRPVPATLNRGWLRRRRPRLARRRGCDRVGQRAGGEGGGAARPAAGRSCHRRRRHRHSRRGRLVRGRGRRGPERKGHPRFRHKYLRKRMRMATRK